MSCHRFSRRCRPWFLASCLFLASHQALAWNAAGHRLSAVIAWSQMSPPTRLKVETLLAAHPAQSAWLRQLSRGKNPYPTDGRAQFAEASTWADDIRRDRRFSDETGAEDDEYARHRDWHYVNWLIGGSDRGRSANRGGGLDRALAPLLRQLADPAGAPRQRAIALVWLLHLLADGHQPLHVASWRLADGSDDDGGLAFQLADETQPRFATMSLHAWWDDLPGPPWLRGERLLERAAALLDEHPAAGIRQGRMEDWLAESFELARHSVRPPAGEAGSADAPWPVTAEYRAQARKVSDRRVAEAGVRLGRLLDATLRDSPSAAAR